MIPSLEGWPTKAKEAPSPLEVRIFPLDTNPVFQSLGGISPPFAEDLGRSMECKNKIFKRRNQAKIIQKILWVVQFFSLEHQNCTEIPRSGPIFSIFMWNGVYISIFIFRDVFYFISSFLWDKKDFPIIFTIYSSKPLSLCLLYAY